MFNVQCYIITNTHGVATLVVYCKHVASHRTMPWSGSTTKNIMSLLWSHMIGRTTACDRAIGDAGTQRPNETIQRTDHLALENWTPETVDAMSSEGLQSMISRTKSSSESRCNVGMHSLSNLHNEASRQFSPSGIFLPPVCSSRTAESSWTVWTSMILWKALYAAHAHFRLIDWCEWTGMQVM